MAGKMVGYARVSSRDQNEERQVIALKQFGVPEEGIVVEKQSGKDFERPVYKRAVKKLQEGDVLVVESLDRLGRNYEEIIEQWRHITKVKKAAIVVIDMPLLDTRKERDLTGVLISDIVLQLLSYVAQTEREFIKKRQAEGIAAAKARGVKFGPVEMEKPENFQEVMDEYIQGKISQRQAGIKWGVSRTTAMKWVNQNKEAVKARISPDRGEKPQNYKEVMDKYLAGEIPDKEAAKQMGVGVTTAILWKWREKTQRDIERENGEE